MSLSSVLLSSTSGLLASQASLRAVSDNLANVNTPGYVRKAVDLQPLVVDGAGMGVSVERIRLVTDQYLQLASLTASSDSARWSAVSRYLDSSQSLFGDPSGANFFFNRLDSVFSAFAVLADDPTSSALRSQAINNAEDFLSEAERINAEVGNITRNVETQIASDVARANDILREIDSLNHDISRAAALNRDATGSENIQSQLIDELAGLMNVRVAARTLGGVVIRSASGVMLSGEGASTLTYNRTDSTRGYISVTQEGSAIAQPIEVQGGQIKGLMELRNDKLPDLLNQLGEFVSRAVQQINAAHNASSAVPAPSVLTGRDTGLDLPSAVTGFSGTSTVAIVNAAGVVQRRVAINFSAGTMTVDAGAPTPFTPATFLADLNVALGAFGTASFAAGQLSIAAAGANGVAISEGTSMKAGRAFSHFFGLNDMITANGIAAYETGLTAASAHGFTPGGQITLRLSLGDGRPVRDVTVTVPAAPTMNDLLNALNNPATGVGLYGGFSLDADGRMSFTSTAQGIEMAVLTDNTQRGVGGPAISELFGLGVTPRSARAGLFEVNPAIRADPTKLAVGWLDLTVGAGLPALRAGDGRGAGAIATSGDQATQFQPAGSLGAVFMAVSLYAAQFGGSIGREAANADARLSSADAVKSEADARRQSVEGVNLDEELVMLTTYQQAFNASARMIQAARDLFDVLIAMA
jgi:flagellar hook-associated protein 1